MTLDSVYATVGKIVCWFGIVSCATIVLLITLLAVAMAGGSIFVAYAKAKARRAAPLLSDPRHADTAKHPTVRSAAQQFDDQGNQI
jgi:hypothetical protein